MNLVKLVIITASITLAGCTANISPDSYSVGSVGQVNRSVPATIISAREVSIEGTQGVGTAAGAGLGATAGSGIGGSARGNLAGAIAGAVAGGVVGAMAEKGATQQVGMEYVVQTENGSLMTLVQGAAPQFAVGQSVLVLYGSPSRIIADPR